MHLGEQTQQLARAAWHGFFPAEAPMMRHLQGLVRLEPAAFAFSSGIPLQVDGELHREHRRPNGDVSMSLQASVLW